MDGKRKLHGYFNTKTLWITVIVLLLLTLITSGLIVGLYARQVTAQEKTDGAVVAAAGGAVVYEHKAEVIPDRSDVKNGIYKLNMDVKVTSNEYPTIVPGTEIPKDPFIEFTGTNDVAYYLYLEVVDSSLRDENGELTDIRYLITSGIWEETDAIEPRHGGTVYVFCDGVTSNPQPKAIEPHRTESITNIIQDKKLYVSENFKDISDKTKNTQPYRMEFYAYLVQKD